MKVEAVPVSSALRSKSYPLPVQGSVTVFFTTGGALLNQRLQPCYDILSVLLELRRVGDASGGDEAVDLRLHSLDVGLELVHLVGGLGLVLVFFIFIYSLPLLVYFLCKIDSLFARI